MVYPILFQFWILFKNKNILCQEVFVDADNNVMKNKLEKESRL